MFESFTIRKGMPETRLNEADFKAQFRRRFEDPRFAEVARELDQVAEVAWRNYQDGRKAPRTRQAGPEFKNPDYELSTEWLETKARLDSAAQNRQTGPSRVLIVNGSPRNEHTCPGEESKSYRLIETCRHALDAQQITHETLDLSLITAQYGKNIYPCKACVSTAMPLCHWPCSCYPNHSLNQTADWMAEIYEMWVRAHGILIITPVHWYQAPSTLKLMIDRLVCADGGNPDPSSTLGKTPELAKQMELDGWDYPKHLAGRAFAVVVHGDAAGVQEVRRNLCDWLTSLGLIQAGASGAVEDYIGYYEPYATSHEALDKQTAFVKEVEIAAQSLVRQIGILREGGWRPPDHDLKHAREK